MILASTHRPAVWSRGSVTARLTVSVGMMALALLSAFSQQKAKPPTPLNGIPVSMPWSQCPNGHTSLKKVPIIYGLLAFENEEARAKWEKGVENFEHVAGGCCVEPGSPKYRLTCTTCRFSYHQYGSPGSWILSSEQTNLFPKPLGSLLLNFPMSEKSHLKGTTYYTQAYNDRSALSYESVSFQTTEPASEKVAEISEWLKQKGIETSFISVTNKDIAEEPFRESFEWRAQKPSLSINLYHDLFNKTSQIHATFQY
jgi:hypothetical protein